MNIIRTPDERFENLPGFAFQPQYLAIPDPHFGSLRMHYLDEGPPDGATGARGGSLWSWDPFGSPFGPWGSWVTRTYCSGSK